MSVSENDRPQFFTTILAYALPILQFFFSQLTGSIQSLFLFKDYFIVVSVFTAITSYVMIIVLRASPWFQIVPMQLLRKKRHREWNAGTDGQIYTVDEIRAYHNTHKIPAPLKSIRPDNIIPVLFLPGLLLGFLVFLGLGLTFGIKGGFKIEDQGHVIVVVGQALAYAAFIVFSVLAFAQQYIRDAGAKTFRNKMSSKYEKTIELARKRDAFKELKRVSLVTQKSMRYGDPSSEIAFIMRVDEKYFVLLVDSEIDTIILVKEFDNINDAETYVWSDPQPNEVEESQ